MTIMQRTLTTVCILLFVSGLGAQAPPLSKRDKAAIQRARKVLISTFDSRLPKVGLDDFLKSEGDGVPIRWEVNDCGEQTGNPAVDRGRDFPICAEALMALRDGRTVSVSVAVGTHKKGVSGRPELFYVTMTGDDGAAHSVRLVDLPAQIHRRGRPGPLDLPPPARGGY